jgi:5-hydroxyisourate hydrolase
MSAGGLTTHVLDTEAGRGASGLKVVLYRVGAAEPLAEIRLDDHGRGVLLEALERGVYELVFHAADYHRAQGAHLADPPFLGEIPIRFGVAEPDAHHHVPLLLTRHSFTAYRGG